MNKKLYAKFRKLNVNTLLLGLEETDSVNYFCTPIGAEIIGSESGGIHYCFVHGFGEMVFAVNPCSCCDYYVYPLARNFADFLSLLLAVKSTTVLEQIILWKKQDYIDFINSPEELENYSQPDLISVLTEIKQKLGIKEMEWPFEYVKELQKDFDYKQIPFSDEYYAITGREKN